MYQKPVVTRFGTVRDLTQLGCFGASDGFGFEGASSVGSGGPIIDSGGTIYWCFINPRS